MLAGDPHLEHPRTGGELERRLEHDGLAVDAGVDRPVGVDPEPPRRPFVPRLLPVRARPAEDGDAEHARVHAWPRAVAYRRTEAVDVVRDEQGRSGALLG